MSEERMHPRACVALIAHDSKKGDLIEFARCHLEYLSGCEVVATEATARVLRQRLGLEAVAVKAGPAGGDVQIGARIVAGGISAVFFLRDAMTAQPHEADILALLRLCDVCEVPYATNLATARLLARELFGCRTASSACADIAAGFDASCCQPLQAEA
ncbi:methylglyoxal synthase [Lysobacter sp. K5869]|uniref:methylglyoxal synthase n=1 Tax=Lysobacter sp. K5869 TaxID=2820808 RepID=UPI001C063179|nr:methylglyoxal synthase [Lysobacter sp. K5869]QWP76216.1 methylglyoxal synthase [Lysobacter sp. K5869]